MAQGGIGLKEFSLDAMGSKFRSTPRSGKISTSITVLFQFNHKRAGQFRLFKNHDWPRAQFLHIEELGVSLAFAFRQ